MRSTSHVEIVQQYHKHWDCAAGKAVMSVVILRGTNSLSNGKKPSTMEHH